MTRRARLDAELVRRGLARSREQAAELVAAGQVRVPGRTSVKPATQVDPATPIVVAEPAGRDLRLPRRAQAGRRAGRVRRGRPGRRGPSCLDAGASTGGFTDVLLRRGAARGRRASTSATASWPGRCRPTTGCTVLDRTNVRDLTAGRDRRAGRPRRRRPVVHLAAAGAARAGRACAAGRRPGADGQAAVRGRPGARSAAGGVVRDPELRAEAVAEVAAAAHEQLGLGVAGVTASPLPGPAGNVEYFLWLRRDAPPLDPDAARRAPSRRGRHDGVGSATATAASCSSATPAADEALRSRRGRGRAARGRRASRCGSSPTRPPTSALTDVEVVDARRRTPPTAASSSSCSAATARCCAAPSWPGRRRPRCSGVNLGHVGFLAEAERDALDATVDQVRRPRLRRSRSG